MARLKKTELAEILVNAGIDISGDESWAELNAMVEELEAKPEMEAQPIEEAKPVKATGLKKYQNCFYSKVYFAGHLLDIDAIKEIHSDDLKQRDLRAIEIGMVKVID